MREACALGLLHGGVDAAREDAGRALTAAAPGDGEQDGPMAPASRAAPR
jgi:hypothetical protein